MKKLMIAAAAVAMVSGAFAVDGYDFTATLKTTVGKGGKDATLTYNFGKDAWDNFWYKDGGWADADNNYMRQVSSLSNNVKTVTKYGQPVLGFIKDDNGYVTLNDADDLGYIQYLADEYNVKSAGVWCETVKVLVPAQCYRVAGTKKIKTVVANNGCCGGCMDGFFGLGDGTGIVYGANEFQMAFTNTCDYTMLTNVASNVALLQSFGAQTAEKSTKVEIFAPVFSWTTDGVDFQGFLAGQGTRPSTGFRVNTISGNIVGTLAAPTCENCCTDPSKAIAFSCYNTSTQFRTAAYGSFRIKYNKKYFNN